MELRRRFSAKLIGCYLMVALLMAWARPGAVEMLWGLLPVILGEALRIWGTGHLRKNEAVIVSGPYSYLRDPLYAGTLLILTGFCIAARVYEMLILGWLLFFVYYLPYKRRREGDRLAERFGATYEEYRKNVMAVIPRLTAYSGPGSRARWSGRLVRENSEVGTAVAVVMLYVMLLLKLLFFSGLVFPGWHWPE